VTGALAAEWVKLRSVRSTWTVLAIAGAAALVAAFAGRASDQVLAPVVQLCLGVLGVLAITAEYTTGTIRASVTAVPPRWPVLAAKALVVAAVALGAGGSVALAARSGMEPVALGCSVVTAALVGLGLGAATRSTTAAIAALVALLFVIPALSLFVPPPWGGRLAAVTLPGLAGAGEGAMAILAGGPAGAGRQQLSPLAALLAMAGYIAAALIAGWFAICRRDV
jgi:ABC-2 type transport system permease protein